MGPPKVLPKPAQSGRPQPVGARQSSRKSHINVEEPSPGSSRPASRMQSKLQNTEPALSPMSKMVLPTRNKSPDTTHNASSQSKSVSSSSDQPASDEGSSSYLQQSAAMAFFEADVDGDHRLNWKEFQTVCPASLKDSLTEDQLFDIFNAVDDDGSGDISMDEYFLWTLGLAEEQGGTGGLEAAFKRYDKTGEGVLDADEFSRAVEDMGFGSIGHELFLEMDKDEGGTVAYSEMIQLVRSRTSSIGRDCKRFLTAMAFDKQDNAVKLDPSSWAINGTKPTEIRDQIQAYLLDASARVSDLYHLMTKQGSKQLTKSNFVDAMYDIGYACDPVHVESLFDEMDTDESGIMGVEEMYSWMNGKLERAKKSREINFSHRHAGAIPLSDIIWDQERLRRELQMLLIHCGLAPLDLLRGWDRGKDGSFSKKEFIVMMKQIVNDVKAWDLEIKEVVKDTFDDISGGDDIDIVEFERWLSKGWLKEKANFLAKAQAAKSVEADVFTQKSAAHAASAAQMLSSKLAGKGLTLLRGLGCDELSQKEREYRAACILQRKASAFAFRKRAAAVIAFEMTEIKAAILIQSQFRIVKARKELAKRKEKYVEHKAAIRMQSSFRRWKGRKERQRLLAQKVSIDEWPVLTHQHINIVRQKHGTTKAVLSDRRCDFFPFNLTVEDCGAWQSIVQDAPFAVTASELCNLFYNDVCQQGGMKRSKDDPRILLINGPAAAGKTCLASRLAVASVEHKGYLAESDQLVPIVVQAASLHKLLEDTTYTKIFNTTWNWIEAVLQIEHGSTSRHFCMLRQAMLTRHALVIIDGIDEAGQHSAKIQQHILEVLGPQGHIIVATCRPQNDSGSPWPSYCARVTIQSLSQGQQREIVLLRSPLATLQESEGIFQWLTTLDAQLSDANTEQDDDSSLMAQPFMLAMLTDLVEHVYRNVDPADTEDIRLPSTPTKTYTLLMKLAFSVPRTLPLESIDTTRNLCEAVAMDAKARSLSVITEEQLYKAARIMASSSSQSGLAPREMVGNLKTLVLQGELPLISLVQAAPFAMTFSHSTVHDFLFVQAAIHGHSLPVQLAVPWTWTLRWLNVTEFGFGTGDRFSKALYFGCVDDQDSQRLLLRLQNRLVVGHKLQTARRKKSSTSLIAETKATEETVAQSSVLQDRTCLLKAVALMCPACLHVNLQQNNIGIEEVRILATGLRPWRLQSLDLSENPLTDAGVQIILDTLMAHGPGMCVLHTLQLRDCRIGARGVTALIRFIQKSTALEEMDLRANELPEDGMCKVGHTLLKSDAAPLSYIRCDDFELTKSPELRLRPFSQSEHFVAMLAGALKANETLSKLVIENSKCNLVCLGALAASLSVNTTITSVNFTNVNLGDIGVDVLSKSISIFMEEIVLDRCCCGESGAKSIADKVRGCSMLRRLVVSNNHIHEVGVVTVSQAVKSLPKLVELDVGGNAAGMLGAGRIVGPARGRMVAKPYGQANAIVDLVNTSPSLVKLSIQAIGLTGDEIRSIGEALMMSKSRMLRLVRCDAFDISAEDTCQLHLCQRGLNSTVAPLLAGIISRNTALTSLDLQANGLGDAGVKMLALGLRGSCLRTLNLTQNCIRAEGLSSLASGMEGNVSLKTLNLSSNEICGVGSGGGGRHSSAGLKTLASTIGTTMLTKLILCDTWLEASGAKALALLVRSAVSLQELNLSNNNLTFFGLDLSGFEQLMAAVWTSDSMQVLRMNNNHLTNRAFWMLEQRVTEVSINAQPCTCHHCEIVNATSEPFEGVARGRWFWQPSRRRRPQQLMPSKEV